MADRVVDGFSIVPPLADTRRPDAAGSTVGAADIRFDYSL
jgi:hypothetical protein